MKSLFRELCNAESNTSMTFRSASVHLYSDAGDLLDVELLLAHDTSQTILDTATRPENAQTVRALRLLHALPELARAAEKLASRLQDARDVLIRSDDESTEEIDAALRDWQTVLRLIDTGTSFEKENEDHG